MPVNALCILLILKLTIATVAANFIAKLSSSVKARRLPLRKASLFMNASDQGRLPFMLTTGEVFSAFLQREIGAEVEIEASRVEKLRIDLLHWYTANRRLLPWRGDTIEISALPSVCKTIVSDPLNIEQKFGTASDVEGKASPTVTFVKSAYGTWISEIMLQQTRVETVIPYWLKWIDRFPDVTSLANATGDDVNAMWAGLGYYRRAQQLLKGAQKVRDNFDGIIPGTVSELRTIDGIGPYTAGAIASIAFNNVEALVDGNVIRVLSRLFALKETVGSSQMEKVCWSIARELVDTQSPGDFNQGLMELGAIVCKPTSPSCTDCPLRTACNARILVDHANKKEIKHNCQVEGLPSNGVNKINESDSNIPKKKKRISVKKAALILDYEIDVEDSVIGGVDETLVSDTGLNTDGLPLSISYFPQKKTKKEAKEILVSVSVIVWNKNGNQKMYDDEDKYLFIRRPNLGGLLANQWEFPNIIISDDICDKDDLENDSNATKQRVKIISESNTESEGKVKSKTQENAPVNTIKTQTAKSLWGPMPAFLRGTLGVDWIPHNKNSRGVLVPTSSVEPVVGTDLNENNKGAKLSSTRKRKSASMVTTTRSDIDESQSNGRVNELDNTFDGRKAVIRVEAICPCVALPPLLHVFSHQRHTMHVTLSTVSVQKISHCKEENSRDDVIKLGVKNKSCSESKTQDPISKSLNKLQTIAREDIGWETLCGDKREIRWMTASEIILTGITSGCKKILTEVLKSRKNTKIHHD